MINGGGRSIQTFLCTFDRTAVVTTEFRDNCYPLFSRTSKAGREWWKRECRETVHQLLQCTVRVALGSVQRGWGQFDARR